MLVLKIIGIVLLSLLALILLLVLIILFVPIRYEAAVRADGTDLEKLDAEASAHWLLHLVSIGASFKEKQFKLSGHIAWKKLFEDKKEKEEKPPKSKRKKEKAGRKEVKPREDDEELREMKEFMEAEKPKEKQVEKAETKQAESKPEEPETKQPESKPEEPKPESKKTGASAGKQKQKKTKAPKAEKEKKKKDKKPKDPNSLPRRLKRLYEKRDKVERVYEKEKANLQVALRRTGRILKKILPRKCLGSVEFGLSDPAETGKILGYISALYALTGPLVNLYPDFTEEKLKADVRLKGHFTLFSVGLYLLQVPFNKELRRAYRYLKKLSMAEPEKETEEPKDSEQNKENSDSKDNTEET